MRGDSGGALVHTAKEDRGRGRNLFKSLAGAGGRFRLPSLLLAEFLEITPFGGALTAASQAGTFLPVVTRIPKTRGVYLCRCLPVRRIRQHARSTTFA